MTKVIVVSTVGLIYDGITSVIVSYLEAMNLADMEIHIVATIKSENSIRKQLNTLGCIVIDFPDRKTNTLAYAVALMHYIRQNKISVIHAHGNSGTLVIEMMAAWLAGCKKRIAHSHNTRCDQVKADKLFRPLFNLLYTNALACGVDAGKWLYKDRTFTVLKNGRDIEKYRYNEDIRKIMRKNYGIAGEIVLGHVGGFVEQKNHGFLMKIFREVIKKRPDAKCFLVGEGALREKYELENADLKDNLFWVGITDRIEDYLQMMDVMLLPSLFEGFPLVTIEWQINGLPCLIADTITEECVLTDLIKYMSLERSAAEWADEAIGLASMQRSPLKAGNYSQVVKTAGFDIRTAACTLRDIYLGE